MSIVRTHFPDASVVASAARAGGAAKSRVRLAQLQAQQDIAQSQLASRERLQAARLQEQRDSSEQARNFTLQRDQMLADIKGQERVDIASQNMEFQQFQADEKFENRQRVEDAGFAREQGRIQQAFLDLENNPNISEVQKPFFRAQLEARRLGLSKVPRFKQEPPTIQEELDENTVTMENGMIASRDASGALKFTMPPKETPQVTEAEIEAKGQREIFKLAIDAVKASATTNTPLTLEAAIQRFGGSPAAGAAQAPVSPGLSTLGQEIGAATETIEESNQAFELLLTENASNIALDNGIQFNDAINIPLALEMHQDLVNSGQIDPGFIVSQPKLARGYMTALLGHPKAEEILKKIVEIQRVRR